jgi:hypothetical protein
MSSWEAAFALLKKKGSDAGAAAAAVPVPVPVENPFEITCRNFNQFYAMPLPNGRVRPIFPTFSPPNISGVDYSFVAYSTPEFKGDLLEKFQILFLNQKMFEHYYKILQYFPCEEARNLESEKKKYIEKGGDKYLKIQTSNLHEWKEMSAVVGDISCVKKSFVYFVFKYIVEPIVERWKLYTDEQSEIDEQYLSALLQFELLNQMNTLLLVQKRTVYIHCGEGQMKIPRQYAHGKDAYSLQEQQVVDSLKKSLETAIEQLLPLQEQQIEEQRQQQIEEQRQQQIEKQQEYWKEDNAKYYAANPEAGPYDYLGGSKRQRRQRSKRQRRQRSKRQRRQRSKRQRRQRQKTKKYYK